MEDRYLVVEQTPAQIRQEAIRRVRHLAKHPEGMNRREILRELIRICDDAERECAMTGAK